MFAGKIKRADLQQCDVLLCRNPCYDPGELLVKKSITCLEYIERAEGTIGKKTAAEFLDVKQFEVLTTCAPALAIDLFAFPMPAL